VNFAAISVNLCPKWCFDLFSFYCILIITVSTVLYKKNVNAWNMYYVTYSRLRNILVFFLEPLWELWYGELHLVFGIIMMTECWELLQCEQFQSVSFSLYRTYNVWRHALIFPLFVYNAILSIWLSAHLCKIKHFCVLFTCANHILF